MVGDFGGEVKALLTDASQERPFLNDGPHWRYARARANADDWCRGIWGQCKEALLQSDGQSVP